jgi:hypothetical protein
MKSLRIHARGQWCLIKRVPILPLWADTVDKVGDEPDEALDWSPLRSFLRTYSVNLRQLCVS